MSFLVPFSSYMKLGQGFNSYTQEVCIEDAVLVEARITKPAVEDVQRTSTSPNGRIIPGPTTPVKSIVNLIEQDALSINSSPKSESTDAAPIKVAGPPAPKEPSHGTDTAAATAVVTAWKSEGITSTTQAGHEKGAKISQIVTYSASSIETLSELVDILDISASASIKYGTVKGSGSSSFLHENTVSRSDLNYIITVKVTNQTILSGQMTFNPIPGLNPKDFTAVFGDCFISGFQEGGKFSAIISIRVLDKSKIKEVKAAAEANFAIAAAPGLSAGTNDSLDHKKSDLFKDTEIVVSVNWSGGGDIKSPEQKWDVPTVMEAASRFPHLVQFNPQITSAILTRYTSLRSFVIANTKLERSNRFVIKNYEVVNLYTQELFSAFVMFKNLWASITDIMKHPELYQALEKTADLPDPVELDPERLHQARCFIRKAMTIITEEAARLVENPELAGLDDHGDVRPLPYAYPGELARRLPTRRSLTNLRQLPLPTNSLLSTAESAFLAKYLSNHNLHFSSLAGDPTPHHSVWLFTGQSTPFCTLDTTGASATLIPPLSLVRFHAHEHHHADIFADLLHHSKASQNSLSAVGFSTAADSATASARETSRRSITPRAALGADGTAHHVGRPADNPRFWSRLGDLQAARVTAAVVEYLPGSGRVVAAAVLDGEGKEVCAWRGYGREGSRPGDVKVEVQKPPEGKGWLLVGFWGWSDAIVIGRLGAVWSKV